VIPAAAAAAGGGAPGEGVAEAREPPLCSGNFRKRASSALLLLLLHEGAPRGEPEEGGASSPHTLLPLLIFGNFRIHAPGEGEAEAKVGIHVTHRHSPTAAASSGENPPMHVAPLQLEPGPQREMGESAQVLLEAIRTPVPPHRRNFRILPLLQQGALQPPLPSPLDRLLEGRALRHGPLEREELLIPR